MRHLPWWIALLAVPLASAQAPVPLVQTSLALSFDEAPAPIATETTVRIPYRVEYAVDGPHAGPLGVALQAADVPPGWTAELDPGVHETSEPASLPTTYVFDGEVVLRHDGTPRAFAPHVVAIGVLAPGDDRVVAPARVEADLAVQADWRPGLYAVLAAPRLVLGEEGGRDALGAELRNTGNADAVVAAQVVKAPAGCAAKVADAPKRLAPDERGTLRLDVDCGDGWSPGRVTVRLTHALALDAARQGAPVEPQWDLVLASGNASSGLRLGGGGGGARTYGDAPIESGGNQASWGAVLLVPAALGLAARLRRRG